MPSALFDLVNKQATTFCVDPSVVFVDLIVSSSSSSFHSRRMPGIKRYRKKRRRRRLRPPTPDWNDRTLNVR
jgi:hypothetical protein